MGKTTVEVHRSKKDKNPIQVEYDFGSTIDEAVAKFDGPSPLDKVVFACFLTGAKMQLQDMIRRCLARTKTVGEGKNKKTVPDPMTHEQIAQEVANWRPEIKRRGISPITKAEKLIGTMTEDEKAELIRRLQSTDDEETPAESLQRDAA